MPEEVIPQLQFKESDPCLRPTAIIPTFYTLFGPQPINTLADTDTNVLSERELLANKLVNMFDGVVCNKDIIYMMHRMFVASNAHNPILSPRWRGFDAVTMVEEEGTNKKQLLTFVEAMLNYALYTAQFSTLAEEKPQMKFHPFGDLALLQTGSADLNAYTISYLEQRRGIGNLKVDHNIASIKNPFVLLTEEPYQHVRTNNFAPYIYAPSKTAIIRADHARNMLSKYPQQKEGTHYILEATGITFSTSKHDDPLECRMIFFKNLST